jgi:hypothetical protein
MNRLRSSSVYGLLKAISEELLECWRLVNFVSQHITSPARYRLQRFKAFDPSPGSTFTEVNRN